MAKNTMVRLDVQKLRIGSDQYKLFGAELGGGVDTTITVEFEIPSEHVIDIVDNEEWGNKQYVVTAEGLSLIAQQGALTMKDAYTAFKNMILDKQT